MKSILKYTVTALLCIVIYNLSEVANILPNELAIIALTATGISIVMLRHAIWKFILRYSQ